MVAGLFVRDRKFYRTLLTIAIPIMLQALISYGVNLMDTLMLGQLGEISMSASSLANSFYMVFNVICLGLGGGAAVITAQFWGKRDLDSVHSMTSIVYKMALSVAAVFTVATLVCPELIMRLYTDEPEIIAAGMRYLRIIAVSYAFHSLTVVSTAVLRSVNIVRVSLFASIVAFFCNVFFNYVFIFGKFGAPEMGVAGAALGTLIARIAESVITVGYIFLVDERMQLRLRHFLGFDGSMFRRYLKNGAAVLVSDLVMVLGMNMIQIIIGHIGQTFVAACSIVAVVNQTVTIFSQALSASSSVLTGNTIGRGEQKKAYDQGITLIMLGLIIGVVMGMSLFAVKWPIINLYNVEQATKDTASEMIAAASFILWAQCLDGILTKGILRGGGDTKFLIFGDTVFTWIAAVPLGYAAAFVWHLPIWAIYTCLKADAFLKLALCLWRFFSKRWIHDVTVRSAE